MRVCGNLEIFLSLLATFLFLLKSSIKLLNNKNYTLLPTNYLQNACKLTQDGGVSTLHGHLRDDHHGVRGDRDLPPKWASRFSSTLELFLFEIC